MVRNPIEATYSFFKMQMREASTENSLELFKQYGRVSMEMFEAWIKENSMWYSEYRYMDYIEEYLQYYAPENIKVVLFEELLENTRETLDDVQRFIGLNENEIKTYTKIPHENIGTRVCRNYVSALINNAIKRMENERREEGAIVIEEIKRTKRQLDVLWTDYKEPMSEEAKNYLREYFADSNQRLERFMNRRINW